MLLLKSTDYFSKRGIYIRGSSKAQYDQAPQVFVKDKPIQQKEDGMEDGKFD